MIPRRHRAGLLDGNRSRVDYWQIACIIPMLALSGCGLTNPDVKEIWDANYAGDPVSHTPPVSGSAQIEFEIKKRIYCELKAAVATANRFPVTTGDTLDGAKTLKYRSLIPPGWVAQVSLSLQVDESVALNPGIALNEVMPNAVKIFGVQNAVTTPQSSSIGLGGTLSSTATRIDKFNPQYSIAFLSKQDSKDAVCMPGNDPFERIGVKTPSSSPLIVESNLGIEEWLVGALVVDDLLASDVTPPSATSTAAPRRPLRGKATRGGTAAAGPATKADAVSYEIKFVIVSNANVTPSWKLVRFSANTGGLPFFGTGRIRTHDLIVTIGPDSTQTSNSNLASQISVGVGNANRALLAGN